MPNAPHPFRGVALVIDEDTSTGTYRIRTFVNLAISSDAKRDAELQERAVGRRRRAAEARGTGLM